MAYDLKFLQRVEITGNLDKLSNPAAGQQTIGSPTMWVYNALAGGANNSKAQTVAADYFLGAYGYLTAGDLVYAACSDGYQQLVVTASSSATVTSSAAWTV